MFQVTSAEVWLKMACATFHDTSIQEQVLLSVISSLIALKHNGIKDDIIN